jgi:hypothetical protein
MKILLTILCAIMVLFGGGCALLLFSGAGYNGMFQSVPLALIPAGIAALNLGVLAALWGFARASKPVFVTLIILDAVVVLLVLVTWFGFGLADSEVNTLAGLTAGAFAAKGILTFATLKDR